LDWITEKGEYSSLVGRFHLLMLYPLSQSHRTPSIYHVEVDEGQEEEERVADAEGAGGPERGQHEADVVDERKLGGVHSRPPVGASAQRGASCRAGRGR
jgi:hypothetical protein